MLFMFSFNNNTSNVSLAFTTLLSYAAYFSKLIP